jgi:hypothetical protein
MQDELITAVERLTGRSVLALSDTHIEPDLACEVFLLEPRSGSPAPPEA